MEVPAAILDKLKCNNCAAYLSCAPVYLKNNNTSLCGRCTEPEENVTRNIPYEEIAQLMKFPCKYQARGCTQTLSFVECKTHEEMCEYSVFNCPAHACQWTGIRGEFEQHCREQHADTFVSNPLVLAHDITKPSVKSFILSAFNVLFIIHVKVCLVTKTIYHSARLLDDPALVSRFRLNLDIENEETKFSKHRQVAEQGSMKLQEDQSIALNINTLVGILGVFRGTKFTLTISAKCGKCDRETDLVICNKDWRCMECLNDRQSCENSYKGCMYRDISTKCVKHQWYFCLFNNFCRICHKTIGSVNLDVHYTIIHGDITHGVNTVWTDTVSGNWTWRIITTDFGKVLFVYKYEHTTSPVVYIRTPLCSEKLQTYVCVLEFIHPSTGHTLKRILQPTNNDNNDWCVTLSEIDTTIYAHNNKINIRVNFIQKLN